MEKPRLIIWAVDPFAKDYRKQEAAIRAINQGADATVVVQPVYVWNARGVKAYGDPGGQIVESLEKKTKIQADAVLRKWAAPRLGVTLRPVQVLRSDSTSFTDQARKIVDYALKEKSNHIVATHTPRKNIRKWFAGSFCENLSLVSEVSVLIVPSDWKPKTRTKSILFATDFSLQSFSAFDRILEFAAERKWNVTIFHNIEYPIYPAVDFVYSATDALMKIEEDTVKDAHTKAEAMGFRARNRGIKTRVVVDESRRNHAGMAINREVEKGYSAVVVAAHSGTMHRTFIGGTSKYLIRECKVPVWIFRPVAVSKKKTAAPVRKREDAKKVSPEPPFFS